jgi:hypothetical protein
MNSQSTHSTTTLSTSMGAPFAPTQPRATQMVSLFAAIMITGFGLFALGHGSAGLAPSYIDGIKVTNLAPVEVRPSADEMRAAATFIDARTGAAVMSLPRTVETGAGLLGAQLAMPYYSFGTTTSSTASTKE